MPNQCRYSSINSRFDTLEQSTTQVSKSMDQLEKDLADDTQSNLQDNAGFFDTAFPSSVVTAASNSSFTNSLTLSTGAKPFTSTYGNQHFDQSATNSKSPRKRKHKDSDASSAEQPSSPKRPKKKKNKKKKSKKHHHSSSSELSDSDSSVIDEQMEELINEWKSSQPKYLEDPVTTAIPPPLAKTLETWFWSVYSKEEVKAELSKTVRPENAPALIPTRINEAVFRSLKSHALSKDMPCRFIQNAFMKGTQPLVIVWETLIQLENYLKTSGKNLQVKFSNSLTIDFQQLRKLLDQSL